MLTIPVLTVPGLGGSGPEHWQSHWETLQANHRRVQMPDWERPDLEGWVAALDAAVRAAPALPLIAAHSLGCLAVAHWASRGGMARGALLVAIPDPTGPSFPQVARSFGPVPQSRLAFPTRVVASHDDPYGHFEFSAACATAWGSALSDVGFVGHINAESGLGDWPHGRELLASLVD